MEKHKCKLCLRKFSNGRALGGHVRSHMMNLYTPPKPKLLEGESEEEEEEEEIESLPSSSSFTTSSSEDEQEDKGTFLSNGLREKNSNKSSLLVDHDFNLGAGSVVLQDRESESESSRNLFCRLTKRIRSSRISGTDQFCKMKDSTIRQPKFEKDKRSPVESPSMEAEPLSSISETTPEEDVAYCLMMLSRDKWIKTESIEKSEEEEEKEEDEEKGKEKKKRTKDDFQDYEVGAKVTKVRSRGKYRCETCDKVFRSYQALGGHRASHKRIKLSNFSSAEAGGNAGCSRVAEEQKIHECPVCFKVFSSGQALGGHKRSHGTATLNLSSGKPFSRSGGGEALIDLNLPAPVDDEGDTFSLVEQFSAVSDDEFVQPIKQ